VLNYNRFIKLLTEAIIEKTTRNYRIRSLDSPDCSTYRKRTFQGLIEVANVLIISTVPQSGTAWQGVLSREHEVQLLNSLEAAVHIIKQHSIHFIIIDAKLFDTGNVDLLLFSNYGLKSLIIGHKWTEDRQIEALVAGHWGYCEAEIANQILPKATSSILNGDVWINRNLVPKVIGMLINMNKLHPILPDQKKIEFKNNLKMLTLRELDVAKMISTGENNKIIASTLNISERTVKAHLTSIFQKLNVQDRLRLAILFKEYY
jgi:two-component system nitrate/nitrite response regulator NarL